MKRTYLDILKGKTAKTLSSNFISLGIIQMLRYLVPLIVLPIVTPIIGLKHYGEIAIASSFALIVQIFVNYSFSFMGARDISRHRENMDEVSAIVSKTIFSYIYIYILSVLISIGVIFLVPKFREIWSLMFIALSWPIFSALVCEWFFQGMERMHNITIINAISRFLFLILIVLFLKQQEDYYLYLLFNTLGFVFASAYSLLVMTMKYKCKIRKPALKEILEYVATGKDIFLSSLCTLLFNKLPNIFLGNFVGTTSAGLYDAAFRLQDAGYHSVGIINRVFFPFLARRMDKHAVYRRINSAFSVVIWILLFAFAPILVRLLYPPEFAPSVLLLRILAFSVLFLGISSAYGGNYLLLLGKEKIVRNIIFIVTGCGLLTLVLMVKLWHETGAALCMVLVNASLAICYYIATYKEKNKS